jgi:hypothetical protein
MLSRPSSFIKNPYMLNWRIADAHEIGALQGVAKRHGGIDGCMALLFSPLLTCQTLQP